MITPTNDRVLITQKKAETVSKGGLYIPPVAQKKLTEGTIVAIGENAENSGVTLRVGDQVMYDLAAGTPITDTDGTEMILVRAMEILALVTDASVPA